MMRQWVCKAAGLLFLGVIGLLIGGCGVAAVVGKAIPKSEDAQYKGLANQKVAVMVWVDRGIRIDYPNLRLDTANTIQADLIAKTDQAELKETQFPYEGRSVVRFQNEHPEMEGRPASEYAPRMKGITRLISVEISEFGTRSETAVQLLKGAMRGNVKVIEVENGKSKIVYERADVQVQYPPKSPEGVIDRPEGEIYAGTVHAFSLRIAQLFYGHVVEDE
jgi:hypothetical protein